MPAAEDLDDGRNALQVGAVVLAAGQSRRMGVPKLVLPWGSRTVIEHVVQVLLDAGISEIVVVTGGAGEAVETALKTSPARLVRNPAYDHSEMMTSLQIGLRSIKIATILAALVVLGDQPTIEADVVRKVIDTYLRSGKPIVVPSYQMRRGHPWLVEKSMWGEILELEKSQTMRDFLQMHGNRIAYSQVGTSGIFTDIDTPEDYERLKPRS